MSLVIMDFETGGVEPRHPNIQLAAIAVDDDWNELASFNRKIKFDSAACDPRALEINHYTVEAWKDAESSDDVFADFAEFLKQHASVEMKSRGTGRPYNVARISAFNAPFDKDRLWAMADGSFVPAHPQAMCIMQLAMWEQRAGRLKSPSMKLVDVAATLGVSVDGAHDALADVRMAGTVAKVLTTRPTAIVPAVEHKEDIRTRLELMIGNIDPTTSKEDVCAAIVMLDAINQFHREAREALYAKMVPILKERGAIEIGTVKYFHGFTKPDAKCLSVPKALEAIKIKAETVNTETGEAVVDWDLVCDCLSKNAFRPAAAMKFLGDEADKHFHRDDPVGKVEREPALNERKPKQEPCVQVIDTQWIK